ncbi:DNA repair protein RadA [Saprolegnia parasitica CBS 223.65]|uniref:DNA repair protein RadA n=1 Tax=Saprolegnia parasitica (strain CBS 223.65) TaxID=695850 RepID=A0A067C3F8_SAPPC|nr:DNA repair protein RadA [Saprolegnia parasitica CBS 223.65]KDO23655.1 DNA repair protein RadA [Saprolegnia parasitica CBS 223.65]|eukprot:XP_012205638.1 DNA repair protein RadA [Saprolegnia parasitica CBS 223.65]
MLRRLLQRAPSMTARRFSTSSTAAVRYRCASCGQVHAKWQGQCSACLAWNTLDEATSHVRHRSAKPSTTAKGWTAQTRPIRISEVPATSNVARIKLPDAEINWVLGGGIVPGSLTLVAGAPGVGKSTLSLQIAHMMAAASAERTGRVLYVSGEESVAQVKMRSDRLQLSGGDLYLASETNIENVIEMIAAMHKERPCHGVVIDSIQTMYSSEIASPAGNVNQVKECTLQLLHLCKSATIPIIIIGHVTKSGDIAGPKVLEHIVDTVVQLDGESQSASRFLRCTKNRFGTTHEVGVFSMTDAGLLPLQNPLHAFLTPGTSDCIGPGVAMTIAIEGSRPIPVEIQSLASVAVDKPSCRGHGVAYDKLQLIFAVLERRANVSFRANHVFVNVAEGYSLGEPAADLALAVALASTATQRAVRPRTLFLGELALSGHLRPPLKLEPRLAAAAKIGVETCVIPKLVDANAPALLAKYAGVMEIYQVETLVDALQIGLVHTSA